MPTSVQYWLIQWKVMQRNEKQNIHFSRAHQSTARLSRVACAAPSAAVVYWHQEQQSLLQVVTMCIDGLVLATVGDIWLLHNMHIAHCALDTHAGSWCVQLKWIFCFSFLVIVSTNTELKWALHLYLLVGSRACYNVESTILDSLEFKSTTLDGLFQNYTNQW